MTALDPDLEPVLAIGGWKNNAELIAGAAQLGYLRPEWYTLDPTWGLGRFWSVWRPDRLEASDLDPAKSPTGTSVDFTALPWPDGVFDAVVFDPPYKLNGTSTEVVDSQYGVHTPEGQRAPSWQERHALIREGITECVRVLKAGGMLLVKCQNQVCSGAVRWQVDEFTRHAEGLGLVKVDELLLPSYRPQPAGRRQVHARRNYSSLIVFRAGGR